MAPGIWALVICMSPLQSAITAYDPFSAAVSISPDIYSMENPVINCQPPCTLILPPYVLSTATTISMPPVTVTYEDNWVTTLTTGGSIVTTSAGMITSTVLILPPVTTKTIYLSNVIWAPSISATECTEITSSAATLGGIIWLTSSIIVPSPVTITPNSTCGGPPPVVWTYSPGPYPTSKPGGPWPPPPPPPPPPGFLSSISIRSGPAPWPTCKPGQVCGLPCVLNCGGPGCSGICGCIGPFCASGDNCVGQGCVDTGGGGDDAGQSCREKKTASYCSVACEVRAYYSTFRTTTSCKSPECTRTITACAAADSTTTSTTTMSCPAPLPIDDGSPDDQVALIGDGGYGGVIVDPGDFDMPSGTVTVTSVVHPVTTITSTTVVAQATAASATCEFWDQGWGWTFKVDNNIAEWAADGGGGLHGQEKGCGALTGWAWVEASGPTMRPAAAWFNLPFLIKDGCVERAIVSAGGPKISCRAQGFGPPPGWPVARLAHEEDRLHDVACGGGGGLS